MAEIKVVHTADWQLGKPFGRFPTELRTALAEARLDAIDRIGRVATETRAGHILVAGDVFDNPEPGDRIVAQARSRMALYPATWWLMPGNHDHARAGGLWDRMRRDAPANVRVVDTPEPVQLEEHAWLLPAPLEHRRTVEDPTSVMERMETPPGALRIGLAHGSVVEFGAAGESTNMIPPDRARSAGLDYLALGDWHGHLAIGERTAYSGTPEVDRYGREEPGSCLAVSIRSLEPPELSRLETGRYRWLRRRWSLTSIDDLRALTLELRREARLSDVLLSVDLDGALSLADRVEAGDLLERLSHELRHLEVEDANLVARPTAQDVARIDLQGALAGAVATLTARTDAGGEDGRLAAAALERLYVETLRHDGGDGR